MKLSNKGRYAIRALFDIARNHYLEPKHRDAARDAAAALIAWQGLNGEQVRQIAALPGGKRLIRQSGERLLPVPDMH